MNPIRRKNERGVTLVLAAFSLLALLGMAALAIDVSTLYMAHGEAQRAADAAALAGAKMFAASGYTSSPITVAIADICQTSATPGANAAANRQAEAVAGQNLVAGQPAAVQTITCLGTAANPEISVTIRRTALPTFFGRVWGGAANTVTATAVAEAYNPSGSTAPIQMQGVKPWLIPNCFPDPSNPGSSDCGGGIGSFVQADGSVNNNGSYVGRPVTLIDSTGGAALATPGTLSYYRAGMPIRPPAPNCPSTNGSCFNVGSDDYHDNIACSSTVRLSCGQTFASAVITVGSGSAPLTDQATQCLVHATGKGLALGQDKLEPTGGTSLPVVITGGDNNPNPLLAGIQNISRSDSIVTVPISDLCAGGCTGTGKIVGFVQLGITEDAVGINGKIGAVIMNVAGCNPGAGGTPIFGGGISPIPVRLIHQ